MGLVGAVLGEDYGHDSKRLKCICCDGVELEIIIIGIIIRQHVFLITSASTFAAFQVKCQCAINVELDI